MQFRSGKGLSDQSFRIGLVVPSSNTTMETELPEMLRKQRDQDAPRFTFHSSRMRMKKVSAEELSAMNAQADRCTTEVSDAGVDVAAYACLVAVMSQGPSHEKKLRKHLTEVIQQGSPAAEMVTSAGALIDGIKKLGARRVALITPYMKPLTQMVIDCLNQAGIEVVDSISLEISDNREVGRRDPHDLVEIARRLDLGEADAVVLSACVQMPSLPAIPLVEAEHGLPVLSAATATMRGILDQLGIKPNFIGCGTLLQPSTVARTEGGRR
ncbi:MAG: Asp/Glu racemase [Planctomycetes bacterium]|jgi:maleate isomerase|nr:Asp/Glu racemase [Planctomycetota bacterium]MBT6453715.1 Asp/Glu racemase [Planctomycetota bacterium]MBT6541897.1 Asp/Glu racemase [Planctomycetota bacterium]MBT6784100.1 Asp/Glu racemase [Planctomycetota bacterium]MBT6968473.1 Asp/Glu racemase [Planctomycetota bacterium]